VSTVGVVIPTLNEAHNLPELLGDLREVALPLHVIVADGGSQDDTAALAEAGGATVVHTATGRAVQMNGGARVCGAEWLCFLHADVRLPENARHDFEHLVRDPAAEAAVWRLAIDADGWWFRVLERGARVRDRLVGLSYGDQGLLVRRALFDLIGGFPDLPVLEDVAFNRAVRRHVVLRRLGSPLLVSARRWKKEGLYWTWIRNVAVLSAYLAGVSPRRLSRWYRPHRA
jgi:rSAM/selenodomain-associated transferase 2